MLRLGGVHPPPPPLMFRAPCLFWGVRCDFYAGLPELFLLGTPPPGGMTSLLSSERVLLLTMRCPIRVGVPPSAAAGHIADADLGRHGRVTAVLMLELPELPPPWIGPGGGRGRVT